jgi:hypothetical protein
MTTTAYQTETLADGHTITGVEYLPWHWDRTCGESGIDGSAGVESHRRNLEALAHLKRCSGRYIINDQDGNGTWSTICGRCGYAAIGYACRSDADAAYRGEAA